MAPTFPRDLPDVGYTQADLVLDQGTVAAPAGRRKINFTQINDPTWRVTLSTRPLQYSEFAAVEAWWLSLRGGLRTVLFRNPHVCWPKAHGQDQAPANDAGNLVSVSGGNVLSVNSVDAGLVLQAGDFIGLERAGRYYLGRISEASGSGTTRTLTVEPPPFATVAQAGSVVRFAKPALVMRPVPDSWQAGRSGSRYTATFQLVEGQ